MYNFSKFEVLKLFNTIFSSKYSYITKNLKLDLRDIRNRVLNSELNSLQKSAINAELNKLNIVSGTLYYYGHDFSSFLIDEALNESKGTIETWKDYLSHYDYYWLKDIHVFNLYQYTNKYDQLIIFLQNITQPFDFKQIQLVCNKVDNIVIIKEIINILEND